MKKVILGIDPGSVTIGYGVISSNSKEVKPLGYGYISLKDYTLEGKKLLKLHEDLKEILDRYKPDNIALEDIYFYKNAKTFKSVIHSRGVILFTACEANIKVYEYTPLQVKQTISGYGKADKNFIEKLVQSSLNIKSKIKPDDASDALAIALCHLRHLTCS